jgi:hypothetical protein
MPEFGQIENGVKPVDFSRRTDGIMIAFYDCDYIDYKNQYDSHNNPGVDLNNTVLPSKNAHNNLAGDREIISPEKYPAKTDKCICQKIGR